MDNETIATYIHEKLSETSYLSQINQIDDLEHRKIYFKIKKHLDDFLGGYVENRFITLGGLRGTGKTTTLFQIYNYLRKEKNIAKDRVLYISADELKNYLGTNLQVVIKNFIEEIHETRYVNLEEEIFIFIDESHFDENWSITGKIIYDKTRKIFLLFTGSSALNFEMNVDAVRRIKKESIFPMNFHEYLLLKHKISSPKDYNNALIKLILNGESIKDMKKKENEMRKNMLELDISPKKTHEIFLLYGQFPFGLNIENEEIYLRIFHMIDRIIEKDIFSLKSFNTDTKPVISQIITYLALQEPGGTSIKKLAIVLSKPQRSINEILHIIEKTHLIFSVKPYGRRGKQIRKPWKYYFLAPTIIAALRYKLGKFKRNNSQFLGLLAENHVAAYFFKIKQVEYPYLNIYYDSSKNGVDFLLETVDGIIPVEVSIGKKDKKQITHAINKYKSSHGIIISNTTAKIEKKDNIIYIPLISVP